MEFPISSQWRKKRIILTIGAADFFTDCWCNGVYLGHHEGGYLPFEFDLTDALAARMATAGALCSSFGSRIPWTTGSNPSANNGAGTPRRAEFGKRSTSSRGSVCHIEPFQNHPGHRQRTRPLRSRSAKARPTGATSRRRYHSSRGAPSSLDVHDREWQTRSATRKFIPLRFGTRAIPNCTKSFSGFWTKSEKSTLCGVILGCGKSVRCRHSGKEPAMLCLNNKPIYLARRALSVLSSRLAFIPRRQAKTLQDDIAFAREAGFDFLRIHIKLDDPLVLYYADTFGHVVHAGFPKFRRRRRHPSGRQRFEKMLRGGIRPRFQSPFDYCLVYFQRDLGLWWPDGVDEVDRSRSGRGNRGKSLQSPTRAGRADHASDEDVQSILFRMGASRCGCWPSRSIRLA